MESVIQKEKVCLICRAQKGLHRHHVFGGPNRELSERYGMSVWLCGMHHNLSARGVHLNREFDLEVKKLGQRTFEQSHSREEFREVFGKSYI